MEKEKGENIRRKKKIFWAEEKNNGEEKEENIWRRKKMLWRR